MTKRVVQLDALMAEAEKQAEHTVGIVRMVVSLALGVVFVFAVMTVAPRDETVLERQLFTAAATMLGYFLLGLASVVIVRFGHYRPWMAWAAATGDGVFIVASVWLGLINTALPANYMLLIPSMWLVPVAISFGALRFNPALQAYLMALLVAGFVLIAFVDVWDYELAGPPPESANLFLALPPNAMRLAMVCLAGVVLVIAGIRSRALMARAITETWRGANLTRYLPSEVADRLAETGLDALRRGKRQDVAILFTDIRGFTPLSETMTPEEIGAFLTEFRRRVSTAVVSCGGVIDKFIGDAVLVVFGIRDPSDRDAAAAVHCAGLLLKEMDEWSRERSGDPAVRIGVGLHRGEVFLGAIGDETRLEYTVLGDTVNVAARLEELTKETGWPILASKQLLDQAGVDLAFWKAIDTTFLRGRHEQIEIYGSNNPYTTPRAP
ncbi:adenylate/guanylate cyclase domain-containing protein [Hoeflea sp. WL0058]|uniref:Adenylate/guanylate cyclase domain-containing protein n=1 Tax=Flavimaribacter sediminis TaxID=2865987 RepID=A0AAE3D060_9HYPH|nr:adenylate/guanylate cyclase domain-containing protein [Flavimaribacter sediminis]MBW8638120.1 adenylate/guanylate cyclase domain-containing protein [Flavimaribacter sediminis]